MGYTRFCGTSEVMGISVYKETGSYNGVLKGLHFFSFLFFSFTPPHSYCTSLPNKGWVMHYTPTSQSQGCKFVSWNVRGINGAIKRGRVVFHLRKHKGDIYFLQETHLKTSEISLIKRPWMSHIFHSKFTARARGATIIVSKNITFELTNSIEDLNGRFVAV